MRIAAIVSSAGSGRRMHSRIDKPFIKLGQKELICYCLKVLQDSPLISDIIVVSRPKNIPRLERLIKRKGFDKAREVIKGGIRRSDSVFNGLCRVGPDTDIVLVHDCARPFLDKEMIKKTIAAAKKYGASLSAVLVKPTVKEADSRHRLVKRTLDRKLLWEAQTPQAFRKRLLLEAYKKAGKRASSFTDSASLVEYIGVRVRIVKGDYSNIKITTPEDLLLATTILGTGPKGTGRQAGPSTKRCDF